MTTADRILDLMRSKPHEAMTPAELVVRLGISEHTAYKTLQRMRSRCQVTRASHGAYHLPGRKVPPRPARKLLWSRLLELESRLERLADGIESRAGRVAGPAHAAMLEIAEAIRETDRR